MFILEVAVVMVVVVLLKLVAMLVSVVGVCIGRLGLFPEDGYLPTPHQQIGFGQDQKYGCGQKSPGGEGRDAQADEFTCLVICGHEGAAGRRPGLLPAAHLLPEHSGDEEDDAGQGSDVDQEGSEDDFQPRLLGSAGRVGVQGAGGVG